MNRICLLAFLFVTIESCNVKCPADTPAPISLYLEVQKNGHNLSVQSLAGAQLFAFQNGSWVNRNSGNYSQPTFRLSFPVYSLDSATNFNVTDSTKYLLESSGDGGGLFGVNGTQLFYLQIPNYQTDTFQVTYVEQRSEVSRSCYVDYFTLQTVIYKGATTSIDTTFIDYPNSHSHIPVYILNN